MMYPPLTGLGGNLSREQTAISLLPIPRELAIRFSCESEISFIRGVLASLQLQSTEAMAAPFAIQAGVDATKAFEILSGKTEPMNNDERKGLLDCASECMGTMVQAVAQCNPDHHLLAATTLQECIRRLQEDNQLQRIAAFRPMQQMVHMGGNEWFSPQGMRRVQIVVERPEDPKSKVKAIVTFPENKFTYEWESLSAMPHFFFAFLVNDKAIAYSANSGALKPAYSLQSRGVMKAPTVETKVDVIKPTPAPKKRARKQEICVCPTEFMDQQCPAHPVVGLVQRMETPKPLSPHQWK